jgi:hypothetical protein
MKKKKKAKKNKRKRLKKRVKIKRRYKKKTLKRSSRPRKKRRPKVTAKKRKKSSYKFYQSFSKIKEFSLKNLLSYLSTPIFEAYYNFQRERRRRLLKTEEARAREEERRKREKLELVKKMKQEQLKEEIYYSKELKKDMQIFLRQQERENRQQKAREQQKIFDNLRLTKKIAGFEARMNREVAMLEKAAFKAEKEDYQFTLDRVNAIKEKYKNYRLESYRKKLQDLGIQVQGNEDKSALIEKERKLLFQKSEIENTLMSFTRSLRSIAFFCNRSKILGKHLSPLKIVDLSMDTGEVYLKWLELQESEDFILLCYLKDNSIESKKIVLEMKTDPEKHLSVEFDIKSIFQFQETAIDNVVKMIERERNSKKPSEEKKAS